jgi:hypothetical protein
MKKLFIIISFFFCLTGFSQALENGDYSANVMLVTDKTKIFPIYFTVKEGIVKELGASDGAKSSTIAMGNITTYSWVNVKDGVYFSNTFIFTKDKTNNKIFLDFFMVYLKDGGFPLEKMGIGQVIKF